MSTRYGPTDRFFAGLSYRQVGETSLDFKAFCRLTELIATAPLNFFNFVCTFKEFFVRNLEKGKQQELNAKNSWGFMRAL